MIINTNNTALAAATQLETSSQRLSQSLARLSSGMKITSPADDSAGLAVSMKLGAQIGRTAAAVNNVANASSFAQTQDGYLQQVNTALTRMSELTVAAQDVTKTTTDRQLYNQEFQTLASYVSDVATKDFNGVSLFSGNALNVTTDSEGGTFSMGGINANYVAAGVTTTTTTTTFPSANATLGSISSSLASHGSGQITVSGINGSGTKTFQASDTIQTFVNFFNSIGNGIGASYNSSNGQLSMTLPAGNTLSDYSDIIGYMGFSTANSVWIGGSPLRSYNGNGVNTASLPGVTNTTTTTSTSMDISSVQGAVSAESQLETSISRLASDRATIGSSLERLSYTSNQLDTLNNNLTAAKSGITDVDVAQESTNYARQNILVQSGTAMLAQANSLPQSVLRLLS
jgi:flagellin